MTEWVPAFAVGEYRARLDALRARLASSGIDTLLVFAPENVCYLTGYETIGYSSFQALVVRQDAVALFIREMERTVAETTCWIDEFETFADSEDPTVCLTDLLRGRGWLGTRIGIELEGGFVAAGAIDREMLEVVGAFSAKSLDIEPQLVRVRVFAEDYLPGRPRVYSPTYSLYVLNAEQHAIWLTEQLSKWHRQSLEVRDREMQLYETNKQLRELTPEELDRADTRKKLEAQASSERANGRRLCWNSAWHFATLSSNARRFASPVSLSMDASRRATSRDIALLSGPAIFSATARIKPISSSVKEASGRATLMVAMI